MSEVEEWYKLQNIEKSRSFYRADDLDYIIQQTSSLTQKASTKDYKSYICELIIMRMKKSIDRPVQKDNYGEIDINAKYFPDILELYPKEPIDEQSFVGLFCTIFHLIKNKKFKLPKNKRYYSLSQILYIKQEFPDAKIHCKTYSEEFYPNGDCDLEIEFEYQSQEYIRHKHQSEKKAVNCDLIICWEHNWKNKLFFVPIISIKELLENGEFKVHFFDN